MKVRPGFLLSLYCHWLHGVLANHFVLRTPAASPVKWEGVSPTHWRSLSAFYRIRSKAISLLYKRISMQAPIYPGIPQTELWRQFTVKPHPPWGCTWPLTPPPSRVHLRLELGCSPPLPAVKTRKIQLLTICTHWLNWKPCSCVFSLLAIIFKNRHISEIVRVWFRTKTK